MGPRDAYRRRRCLLPIDNFFESRAIKGAKAKQPYAIAMVSGAPFAVAAIWENWHQPGTDAWVRSFAVITCPANMLVAPIHDRMPVIIARDAYDRWLANIELDPRDILVPFPSEPMTMWPISTRVNKPENDDAAILTPVENGSTRAIWRNLAERSQNCARRPGLTHCARRSRCAPTPMRATTSLAR